MSDVNIETKEGIVKDRRTGMSLNDIVNKYTVPYGTVREIIQEAGLNTSSPAKKHQEIPKSAPRGAFTSVLGESVVSPALQAIYAAYVEAGFTGKPIEFIESAVAEWRFLTGVTIWLEEKVKKLESMSDVPLETWKELALSTVEILQGSKEMDVEEFLEEEETEEVKDAKS